MFIEGGELCLSDGKRSPVTPVESAHPRRYGITYSRMPGISRLFEVRPRALWIRAPPPPSRYAVSSRRVCLVLNPRIAAAEISVRRLARTSERTSMRCSSRPLIVTKPNLFLPNLTFGRVVWTFQLCTNRTLQLCAYRIHIQKAHYETEPYRSSPASPITCCEALIATEY